MNIFRNDRLAVGVLVMTLFLVGFCGMIAPDLLKRVVVGAVIGLLVGHGLSFDGKVKLIRNIVFAVFVFIAVVER